jgi:HSP20 family molecular chaperone IbpA
VTLEPGMIHHPGRREEDKEVKEVEVPSRWRSFPRSRFSRSFSVPDNIEEKAIRAEFEGWCNGRYNLPQSRKR